MVDQTHLDKDKTKAGASSAPPADPASAQPAAPPEPPAPFMARLRGRGRQARRTILVPVRATIERDHEGKPFKEPDGRIRMRYEPDFFGQKPPDNFTIKVNYKDVMKVEVTDDEETVNEWATQSREHFAVAWGNRPQEGE